MLRRDMGEEVLSALNAPKTVELMLNPDGKLWVERLGEQTTRLGSMDSGSSRAIIETVAGFHGRTVTHETPIIECELPLDGSRFTGVLPPVVSAPTFAIRRKASSIFTLDQYVAQQSMSLQQRDALRAAVNEHRNILVVGGTGSGKTTLVNGIIHEVVSQSPMERICIIEDTPEVQCAAENRVQFCTSQNVDMTKLLRTTLRMRPDRILVGEVRGPEAHTLLIAWNTGHEGGVATLHANTAEDGLVQLSMYLSMHPDCPRPPEPLIGRTVHIIVHVARTSDGFRRVEEIREVSGYADGHFITRKIC